MAGVASKSNPPRPRKRVDADATAAASGTGTLKRALDGSAFTLCNECHRHVPVALIDMHSCSLDSKIKMHLESQVVERVAAAAEPKKALPKKRAAPPEKAEKKGSGKSRKTEKDPNMPKRPPSAFFVFMAEFRDKYKEAHPDNKKVSAVAKEGGERWKSMTDEEKKPYHEKAAELKAEYVKTMEEYRSAGGEVVVEVEDDESDKEGGCEKKEEDAVEDPEEELEDDLNDVPKERKVGKRLVVSDDED